MEVQNLEILNIAIAGPHVVTDTIMFRHGHNQVHYGVMHIINGDLHVGSRIGSTNRSCEFDAGRDGEILYSWQSLKFGCRKC